MKKGKSVHRQPRGRGEGDDRLGHQIMFKGLLRTLRKCESKMLFEYFALSLNFALHFGMVVVVNGVGLKVIIFATFAPAS